MHRVDIDSRNELDIESVLSALCGDLFGYSCDYDTIIDDEESVVWHIWRNGLSSTPFVIICYKTEGVYSVLMEKLASYEDYIFYPGLCTQISLALDAGPEDENFSFYEIFNNEWVEESISEEIAYLKAVLSAGYRYMFNFGIDKDFYVDKSILSYLGVCLTSSTPRIYGYIQYALKHDLLKKCENLSEDYPDIEVNVPEHNSVGKVKSWQVDGSETWESYSEEDVEMLINIGNDVLLGGFKAEGVTLNDLGTIYMEGIGVEKDYHKAAFWYRKAISYGDLLYAPSNLGDIYRKGGFGVERSLKQAHEAYSVGDDPYAHYRVGQGYEEGWCEEPNLAAAFEWYAKAAGEGHHLALRRLKTNTSLKS